MSGREIRFTANDGLALFARDFGPAETATIPVFCLPGLTRNSLDFADLATHLAARGRRVVCPDFRGRGMSARDPGWASNYAPHVYARDVLDLMAALGIHRAAFVGTSLGGIVATTIAAQRPTAIAGIVLNDIGPRLEPAGLARIAAHTGWKNEAADWSEAVELLRASNAAAVPNLDAEGWLAFARRQFVPRADGRLEVNYDPRIGDAMRAGAGGPLDLATLFQALGPIPTLLLRGALSDLLSAEGVASMAAGKPDLVAVIVEGVGHAPMLDEPEARAAIDRFLDALG